MTVAALLPGCASFLPGNEVEMGAATVRVAPGPAVPAALPVGREHVTFAFLPVEGAPDRVTRSLDAAIGKAAETAGMSIAPADTATYTVKAYLSAVPSGDDDLVVYVFDVLDRNAVRLVRVSGTMAIASRGSDPWRGMDRAAAAHVAEGAATAIAAWLSDAAAAA